MNQKEYNIDDVKVQLIKLDKASKENYTQQHHHQDKLKHQFIETNYQKENVLDSVCNTVRIKPKVQHAINKKRIAFGPPGLNPMKYNVQALVPTPDQHVSHIPKKVDVELCDIKTGEMDSEINIDITNKNILKDFIDDEKSKFNKESEKTTETKCSDTSSTSSSLLQKRLRAYKNITETKLNSSSSDTSIKDSSTNEDIAINYDSDEGISEIIDRLDKEYNFSNTIDVVQESYENLEHESQKYMNNPFQNVDSSISVFVNKLAKPVLMVHSKTNKRIEPVHKMRDIPFNSNIHLALRNLNIKEPMMLQSISWYTVLRGHSLFLISPSKSGKTLGYLPAVCRLVTDYSDDIESVGPIAIIVCATTRSVTYIERMATMFLSLQGKILSCYAGVDDFEVTTQLLNGCKLLISTPSALVRLMQMNDYGVDLRRLCTFVIDDCERVINVYNDEINVFLYKIKQMLKSRPHKELKVQYVLASRVWCSFMETFAKKAPDTVVCIGAFQECVLYSKANTSVVFVKSDNKELSIHNFLKQIDTSKKTVVVCRTDEEVIFLEKSLKDSNYVVFACNNEMTVNDLYNLNIAWYDYEEPVRGPILVCCDGNLMHMNVTDAHNLIHYSQPPLFSMFCKRFAVLNDNYPSIFNTGNDMVKIRILLEDTNIEQLPKIINFVKRCTNNVPEVFNAICSRVLLEKDVAKAKSFVALCSSLLSLGQCPDFYNCQARHTVLKEYDYPLEWMPKSGTISFKIIHCYSPAHFSVKLLSHVANGVRNKFPESYNNLSIKLGLFYSKEPNRQLHGIPKIGDVCAVMLKRDLFVRCQVIKILTYYPQGNPKVVLIMLIDEKKIEKTCDVCLYYLPDNLKSVETYTTEIRLTNIQPKDKDITYSDLATNLVRKIVNSEDDIYVRGRVTLTLNGCIFVDTLEVCNDLKSLDNSTVVRHNIRQELLEKHAINNSDHIYKIKEMCSEIISSEQHYEVISVKSTKAKFKESWSHLPNGDISSVFFASAIDPDTFFIRLDKFETCLVDLLKDIQQYAKNMEPLSEVDIGDIVIAKFPDDSTFERARVDGVDTHKIKCFFVDQGDWREVPLKHLVPITEHIVNKLPFQAIECRLLGVKPPAKKWSEFAINWLYDSCFDKSNNLKHLYVKYFTKELAAYTGGHKYGVILTDTNGEHDVVINQQMINLNLACTNEIDIEYINNTTMQENNKISAESSSEDVWEKKSLNNSKSEDEVEESNCLLQRSLTPLVTSNPLLKQPIRSAPLVGSDDESEVSDRWDINMAEEFKDMFKPVAKNNSENFLPSNLNTSLNTVQTVEKSTSEKDKFFSQPVPNSLTYNEIQSVLQPAKKNNSKLSLGSITYNDETRNVKIIPTNDEVVASKNITKIKELDSDDLSSPESSSFANEMPVKPQKKSRPKLIWRQSTKYIVIKIILIGADYNIDIKERSLSFSANANDTEYSFNFDLYGVINVSTSIHENKGQYIFVKLFKALPKNWLTLTKDTSIIKKWITYDIDYIDTSSDEEDNKPVQSMVHLDSESDTEVEDAFDDVV